MENDRVQRKEAAVGHLTLEWHVNRYGKEIGEKRYCAMVERLSSGFRNGYSKISQELFAELLKALSGTVYFATNNGEYEIFLHKEERIYLNKKMKISVDFFFDKRIIEFNGNYWHKDSEADSRRNEILRNRGYDVMTILESEYKQNKQEIIERCLNFLNGSN